MAEGPIGEKWGGEWRRNKRNDGVSAVRPLMAVTVRHDDVKMTGWMAENEE